MRGLGTDHVTFWPLRGLTKIALGEDIRTYGHLKLKTLRKVIQILRGRVTATLRNSVAAQSLCLLHPRSHQPKNLYCAHKRHSNYFTIFCYRKVPSPVWEQCQLANSQRRLISGPHYNVHCQEGKWSYLI